MLEGRLGLIPPGAGGGHIVIPRRMGWQVAFA